MAEVKRNGKMPRMQFFPIFEDYKTIDLALTWSNKLHIRMNHFIIAAINDWCKRENKTELQFESAQQLHEQLKQFAQKTNRSISSFVEIRVAEYGIKLTKDSLPKI